MNALIEENMYPRTLLPLSIVATTKQKCCGFYLMTHMQLISVAAIGGIAAPKMVIVLT